MAARPPTIHIGYTCDECGASPIVGIRYVAKHLYHYDVCGDCIQDHDDPDSFVPFERPSGFAAYRVCSVEPSRGMEGSFMTLQRAAEFIAPDEDSVRYVHVAMLSGSPSGNTWGSEALRDAFTANTHLEILHLHMCDCKEFEDHVIANVAAGIGANKSIKRLFWHLPEGNRNKVNACAIRDMIASNTSLDFVDIGKACRETASPKKNQAKDEFASIVLEGLRHNQTLRVVRVYTPEGGLSETTKEKLLEIVKRNNKTIKKIYADFEVSDSRLELLLACNREKWLDRFVQPGLTKQKRLTVLVEALEYETIESVSTAFHLLRTFPDFMR